MEFSKKIIKYDFEELKLERIIGETEKKNIKSIKTMEKVGMKKVGKNKDGLIEYEIKNI
jgi:RimJ/RimL family protein N-acetyltransferase